MKRITIDYVDGKSESVLAAEWHKKDDYLWISIANADTLMLVSLLAVKSVMIRTLPTGTDGYSPKPRWNETGTSLEDSIGLDPAVWSIWY
jgi:hypothetical protein